MIPELENFRQKYPEYADIDDASLAGRLSERFPDAYGDLPFKVSSQNTNTQTGVISEFPVSENPIIRNAVDPFLMAGTEIARGYNRGGAAVMTPGAMALNALQVPDKYNLFENTRQYLDQQAESLPETTLDPVSKLVFSQGASLPGHAAAFEQVAPIARPVMKAIGELTGILKSKIRPPEKLIEKSEKLTTELLQPSKQELSNYLERGRKLPAVEQASKVIKKSKNYRELRENIEGVIKKTFSRRNVLLQEKNQKIGNDYLDDLEKLIAKESSKGQAKPEDLMAMQRVLENERSFLRISSPRAKEGGFVIKAGSETKSVKPSLVRTKRTTEVLDSLGFPSKRAVESKFILPEGKTGFRVKEIAGGPEVKSNIRELDLLQAQKRKEYLQDLTNRLLERREGGAVVDLDPAKNRALDAIRKGLAKKINSVDPEIAEINETYGGLLRAKELMAGQEALAAKAPGQNVFEKIVNQVVRTVMSGRANPSVTIMESASKRDVAKITKEIERLQQSIGSRA
jgi:hypothetical protein